MSSPRRRRRRWPWIVAAAILLAGGAVAYVLASKPGDVRNSHAEFVPEKPVPPKPKVDTFSWPILGYSLDRRRYFSTATVKPPYRTRWKLTGRVLLEFPPVIWRGSLYLLSDSGNLRRIDKETGHVYWLRRLGTLAAASPAVGDGSVYVPLLRRPNSENGSVVALNATTGKIRWTKALSSRSESSPAAVPGHPVLRRRGRHRLRAPRGHGPPGVALQRQRRGEGRAGPGQRHRLLRRLRRLGPRGARRHGQAGVEQRHERGAPSASPPARSTRRPRSRSAGSTSATPTAACTRSWRAPASSPGPARRGTTSTRLRRSPRWPGIGPTVYVGSYDGTFYAYDARTGDARWTYEAGNSISGGSTIIGNIVYFATLQNTATTGLDVRTGKKVYSFFDGKFDPVISDGKRLYLDGYRISTRSTRPASPRWPAGGRRRRRPSRPAARSVRAHGDPGRGERLLGLAHAEAAVVEDRRAQHGVGAGLRAPRRGASSSPAPPEAITGTLDRLGRPRAVSSRS